MDSKDSKTGMGLALDLEQTEDVDSPNDVEESTRNDTMKGNNKRQSSFGTMANTSGKDEEAK